MTTHTIEIEGLPEGWEPIAYRMQSEGDYVFDNKNRIVIHSSLRVPEIRLIVKKTKPRRIVLKETEEDNPSNLNGYFDTQSFDRGSFLICNQPKKWRVFNEEGEKV